MKTINAITSVAVDSPTAGSITIVCTYNTETFTQPSQQTTIGEFPANPNWSRAHRLIGNTCYQIIRNGGNPVAFLLNALAKIGIALEPSLSWAPYITTQPTAPTAAGTAAATGTLTGSGSTNVADGDTVTIGAIVYRFKTVMTQAYDIQISGSGNSDGSLGSLIKAINGTGIVGVDCFTGTLANTQVGAGALTAHATLITALAQGLAGNSIATTKSSTVVSWGAASLSGGTDSAITASVAAGATETTQSYQWKYSTDGGVTWANATGTVSGTAFTNGTTATLTCTPTTTGLTGKLLKCTLTNSSGSTDSNSVVYTIS